MTTRLEMESCPPDDAIDANEVVFRCCKSDPPSERDLQTAEESKRLPHADPCLRRALSVFRSWADAEHQLRLFRRWRNKFIARAELSSGHGKTKSTTGRQPSHTSWWPADGLSPGRRTALFHQVHEVRS